jgi:hypothetical protein
MGMFFGVGLTGPEDQEFVGTGERTMGGLRFVGYHPSLKKQRRGQDGAPDHIGLGKTGGLRVVDSQVPKGEGPGAPAHF